MRFSSSSKTSQSRLVKISGRMKSLNFGASCAPRMLHAASQIQDSSDLSLALFIIPRWLGCWGLPEAPCARATCPDLFPYSIDSLTACQANPCRKPEKETEQKAK